MRGNKKANITPPASVKCTNGKVCKSTRALELVQKLTAEGITFVRRSAGRGQGTVHDLRDGTVEVFWFEHEPNSLSRCVKFETDAAAKRRRSRERHDAAQGGTDLELFQAALKRRGEEVVMRPSSDGTWALYTDEHAKPAIAWFNRYGRRATAEGRIFNGERTSTSSSSSQNAGISVPSASPRRLHLIQGGDLTDDACRNRPIGPPHLHLARPGSRP